MSSVCLLLLASRVPHCCRLESALEESERAAKQGLRSVMIPTEVADRSYSEPEYARLWKTVEELGLIVAVRVGTASPS